IDNEAQGLAAEAAARQAGGRGGAGGANAQPPDVRIDWNNLARRAHRLTRAGHAIGHLTAAPEGHSVALTVAQTAGGGGRGAGAADGEGAGMYLINVESGQLTRVPPAPPAENAGRGGGGRGGARFGFVGGSSITFARRGRTRYFRQGTNLYAAPITLNANAGAGGQAAAAGGRGAGGGRGGRGGAPATTPEPAAANANQTARQVTYTANLEVDHQALRAQVFNEGW